MVHSALGCLIPLHTAWEVEDAIRLEAIADMDADYSIDHILQELSAGTMEAWKVKDTAVIVMTRTNLSSKRPFLHIEAVVGVGLKDVIENVVADLKLLAKSRGVERLTATTTRKGWVRTTERLGFDPISINYEMELSDGR